MRIIVIIKDPVVIKYHSVIKEEIFIMVTIITRDLTAIRVPAISRVKFVIRLPDLRHDLQVMKVKGHKEVKYAMIVANGTMDTTKVWSKWRQQ